MPRQKQRFAQIDIDEGLHRQMRERAGYGHVREAFIQAVEEYLQAMEQKLGLPPFPECAAASESDDS